MIKAVVFDFDGVIADTEQLHYRCFQKVLERFKINYSWEEYLEKYIGFDDRDAFKEVFLANDRFDELSGDLLSLLVKEKGGIFPEIAAMHITPYPCVESLIKRLSKLLPLAICSGALRTDIIPILEKLGIKDFFQDIVTADDVSVSKPDPEGYLLAVNRLASRFPDKGITLQSAVAIEDTPAGIASAKSAGMKVIAVTNSYPAKYLSGADRIVDTLCEIDPENIMQL